VNEEHVDDEGDKDHRHREEIRHPDAHGVVTVERLVYECGEEARPDKDERSSYSANHGKAKKRVEKLEELAAKAIDHIQRNKERSEEGRDRIEDEAADIDNKDDGSRQPHKHLHVDVHEDL